MSLIPFDSPFRHGFVRVAVASTVITIANPKANASAIVQLIHDAQAKHIQVLVTPELGLTGYTCDELFQQTVLLDAVTNAFQAICDATTGSTLLCFVGAPIRVGGKLYNCAVALNNGRIVGVVPKQHLPGYREYYEPRYFTAFDGDTTEIEINGQKVPFGRGLLFQLGDDITKLIGVEICEDAWVPDTPSTKLALAGATIICNLSASNVTTGKPDYRRQLITSLSARLICAYAYASGGPGESSNDVAWDGHCILSENGSLLAEHQAWLDASSKITVADIDIDRLLHDRLKFHTFDGSKPKFTVKTVSAHCAHNVALLRNVPQFPYVPSDLGQRDVRCEEVYQIQVAGLVQRLRSSGVQRMVIGISGGLDSTHAALVCCRAADALGWSRSQSRP